MNKKGAENNFCLASDIFAADILVDNEDSKTVLLAAELFSDDIERIAGHKPEVKNQINPISSECIIIGNIEKKKHRR